MFRIKNMAVFLFFASLGVTSVVGIKPHEVLNNLKKNDSLKLYPGFDTGKPVDLKFSFYVNSFYMIPGQDQHIGISVYMRMSWNDPRISFSKDVGQFGVILADIQDKLWFPDLFMRNAVSTSGHTTIGEDAGIKIKYNGDMWLVLKKTVTLNCPMQLHRFPFDTQRCTIIVESYFHQYNQIRMSWLSNDVDREASLPEFKLIKTMKGSDIQNYTAGAYQTLHLDFVLQREYGHYVVYWFLPTMAITGLSYLQFWLPDDALNAKTMLGCFWYLTYMLLLVVSRIDVPKVTYLTAVDKWFVVHLLFLTVSILEVILIHLIKRNIVTKEMAKFLRMGSDGDTDPKRSMVPSNETMSNQERLLEKLTWVLRIAYPVVYILFIAIYWGIYTA